MFDNRYASITLHSISGTGHLLYTPDVVAHWDKVKADGLNLGVDHAATGYSLLFGANRAMATLEHVRGESDTLTIFGLTRAQLSPWRLWLRVPAAERAATIARVIETELEALRLMAFGAKNIDWLLLRGEVGYEITDMWRLRYHAFAALALGGAAVILCAAMFLSQWGVRGVAALVAATICGSCFVLPDIDSIRAQRIAALREFLDYGPP